MLPVLPPLVVVYHSEAGRSPGRSHPFSPSPAIALQLGHNTAHNKFSYSNNAINVAVAQGAHLVPFHNDCLRQMMGGQPVLSFEQCFILFSSFPLLLAFDVGGLGFEFCSSPPGGMLFGVSGLLLLLLCSIM